MANRRLVLYVADDSGGQTPASGLTGGFTPYAAAQPLHKIWNKIALAWQTYQPGNNGDANFGPEINFRSNAPGFGVSEELWTFKHYFNNASLLEWNDALLDTGGAGAGTNYSSFWPLGREAAFTTLVTTLTQALNAVALGGDTAVPEAVVLGVGLYDALSPGQGRAFAGALLEFTEKIKALLETLLAQPAGTYSNLKIVHQKLHEGFNHPNAAARAAWNRVRSAHELVAQKQKASIIRQDGYSLLAGNKTLDIASNISLGLKIQEALFAAPVTTVLAEPAAPVDVFLMLGDEFIAGLADGSNLPSHLTGMGKVWNPHVVRPAFQNLDLTNCIPTIDPLLGLTRFGPEFTFAEAARSYYFRQPYLIKVGQDSFSAQSDTVAQPTFPFYDRQANDWSPADELYQHAVLGWVVDGMTAAIFAFGANVRLRGVVLSLGKKDVLALKASRVGAAISFLRDRITDLAVKERWCNPDLPFVCLLPDGRIGTTPELKTQVAQAQNDILSLANIRTFDPTSLEQSAPDVYTFQSILKSGKSLFNALVGIEESEVMPLFNPNRMHLISALRLRETPQGENVQDVIDEAIQSVKTGFYRRLGPAAIASIQETPFTRNPKTLGDQIRLLAAVTETKWVRMELLRTMPTSFMDGNSVDQQWQHEPAFRVATIERNAKEASIIRQEIEQSLDVLAGRTEFGESQMAQVITYGPDGPVTGPGDTLRPGVQGGCF